MKLPQISSKRTVHFNAQALPLRIALPSEAGSLLACRISASKAQAPQTGK